MRKEVPIATREAILAAYCNELASQKALGRRYGCAHTVIRRILDEAGITPRSKVEQRRIDLARGVYDQGLAIRRAHARGCYDTPTFRASVRRSKNADRVGERNSFFGRHHSQETRTTISRKASQRVTRGTGVYPAEWTPSLRRSIRERDHHRCRACGKEEGMLQVHHIDHDRSNCDPINLITICAGCHIGHHRGHFDVMQAVSARDGADFRTTEIVGKGEVTHAE